MFRTLTVETDERGIATLTLNRPDKHNAMSGEMIAELDQAAGVLAGDDKVRVIVLTGAGRSFSAGADLDWMRAQMQADDDTRRTQARALAMMLYRLNTLPKPLIGRIQGQAFGGGIGLMSVCDLAIGVNGAKFGLTEARLGLIPATIGPYVIECMGQSRARRVFMSARIFDACEAVDLGLLAAAVPAEDLDQAIEAQITPYLSAAPGAVAAAKALALELGSAITPDRIEATIDALVSRWKTDEAKDGIAAFFERKPPPWQV